MTGSSFATLLRVLALIAVIVMPSTSSADAAADAAFQRQFGDRFFDRLWQLSPDWAIANGYYKYADRLIVPDERSRTAYLEQIERWSRELAASTRRSLSPTVRADWEMLDNQFAASRWSMTELRSWQWNPSNYNVAEPFALLTTSSTRRSTSGCARSSSASRTCPRTTRAAKANVASPTREHTQLAIEQNRGALAVFGTELESQIAGSKLAAAERTVFTQRLAAARAAIEDYVAWLEALDATLASGEAAARSFRLGRELYAQKFAFDIQSGDTAEALYERALAEKETLLDAHGAARGSAVAEVLPEHGAAGRPLRQDRPRDRAAVRAARGARGSRRRGRSGRSRSSSAGSASTTCSSSTRPSR